MKRTANCSFVLSGYCSHKSQGGDLEAGELTKVLQTGETGSDLILAISKMSLMAPV